MSTLSLCGNLVYTIQPQYFNFRNTNTLSNQSSLFSYQLFEMVLPWHLFFQIVRHVEKTFKDTNTDAYIFFGHYKGQINIGSGENLSSLKLNENWPKGWSKSCWFDPAVRHYFFQHCSLVGMCLYSLRPTVRMTEAWITSIEHVE